MTDGYLLGVDIGTYSSKGVLVTTDGRIVDSHTVPHGMDIPSPGHFEHDAEKVWWHDFVEIVRVLLERSKIEARRILGIATSGIGVCVLPVDTRGTPLRPAILYGIDARAARQSEYFERVLGDHPIYSANRKMFGPASPAAKIRWIRDNEPDVYRRTRWFLPCQSFLVYKLTGRATVDIYSASGFKALREEAIAGHVAPVERLPEIVGSCEPVGGVTAEAARETGLLEGTPVIAGTTDAASEALSAGISEPGNMMLMLGSTIFFVVRTARPIDSVRFGSSTFLEEGNHVFLGGTSNGASLITWFRDRFGEREIEAERAGGEAAYAALARLVRESPPGARGLVVLPYFAGERTPIGDPHAKGMFFGLSLEHTRADIYRAILEGVTFSIRHNLEAMAGEGLEPDRIIAVGGGTKNREWLQIIADACGVELSIPEQQIGASYGDAFMAGVGTGLFRSVDEIGRWVRIAEIVRPERPRGHTYDFNYALYRTLYERNRESMHALSEYLLG